MFLAYTAVQGQLNGLFCNQQNHIQNYIKARLQVETLPFYSVVAKGGNGFVPFVELLGQLTENLKGILGFL